MKAVLSMLGLTVGLVLVSSSVPGQGNAQADALPPGPGHDTVATACVACHELNRITRSGGYDREGWVQALDRMAAVGAPLPADKKTEVVPISPPTSPSSPSRRGSTSPGR